QDLLGKTDDLQAKLDKANAKSVTTSNGTIVHDFSSKSSIKKVKTIGTIGDSIAKGSLAKSNFTQQLAKKIKAKYTNLAESGATMSDIYQQATKIKGDLIIIQGTDDDWVKNIDIGTDKTDTKTFYGAFYSAVEIIKKNNPKAKLLVMTPARQCYMEGSKVKRKDTDKNDKGKTLIDYVNLQVDICNDLDIPVFDAYRYEAFKPYSPAFRKSSMPDGLHFNDKGHEVIMYELIKDYYQFYDE
ncbi:SGNH/GDSL hydrolase family protein, partial [Staphylococcus haemolyticus]|uniref:SGNH/GDSL hydrolase family protein n=2 Tax=cellular organisms TaxID=131567 RepID=UPI0034D7AA26